MKILILAIAVARFAGAADPPKLTQAQKENIRARLEAKNEAEAKLAAARAVEAALQKAKEATDALRESLTVCGSGYAVAQDANGDLACVSTQEKDAAKK